MEEEADNLKTETSMLKRDLEEVFTIFINIISMISMITILILEQVRNEKSSLELQMEACKAEIKMAEMERPLQQVGGSWFNLTKMMLQTVREDEEVKAQLIQRIDNLTADNDCLKSEMDLVRRKENTSTLRAGVEKPTRDKSKGREELVGFTGFPNYPFKSANLWPLVRSWLQSCLNKDISRSCSHPANSFLISSISSEASCAKYFEADIRNCSSASNQQQQTISPLEFLLENASGRKIYLFNHQFLLWSCYLIVWEHLFSSPEAFKRHMIHKTNNFNCAV